MAQVIDKFKCLSVSCMGLRLVFALEEQTERVESLLFYSSEAFTSGQFFPCVPSRLSPYPPLMLPNLGLVRDMTCLMKLQCSERLELHLPQGNWPIKHTLCSASSWQFLFPGLCSERPASVFPAYVIFSSDFTFLEECVRNYYFDNISHRTLT